MASISLKNVSVSFPIYGAGSTSLKKALAASVTGGRFGKETGVTVVQALTGLSLELKSGDWLGLIGHDGAGKSTHATGIENIMLRGLVMGMSEKEVDRLTPDICEFRGLGEYANMPVHTYSTGMMMRPAFSISTSV